MLTHVVNMRTLLHDAGKALGLLLLRNPDSLKRPSEPPASY